MELGAAILGESVNCGQFWCSVCDTANLWWQQKKFDIRCASSSVCSLIISTLMSVIAAQCMVSMHDTFHAVSTVTLNFYAVV